jgi:hypothetical protein
MKVEAMKEGTHPKTLNRLRGFLGLTGYYRKIVKIMEKLQLP